MIRADVGGKRTNLVADVPVALEVDGRDSSTHRLGVMSRRFMHGRCRSNRAEAQNEDGDHNSEDLGDHGIILWLIVARSGFVARP